MQSIKLIAPGESTGPWDEHRVAAVVGGLAFVLLCAAVLLAMILL